MADFRRIFPLLAIAASLVAGTGCDKIAALFGGSSTASPKNTAPSPSAVSQSPAATDVLAPDVLARVGTWQITIDEFNDRLNNLKEVIPNFNPNDTNTKKAVLDEMIRQQLLVWDAERSGIQKNKDIVVAVEDFRRTLLVQEAANTITKGIAVTEQDAKDFYDKNPNLFSDPAEWKVREIFTRTQEDANAILLKLLQGADFAETAKTESKSKSAPLGGDLGRFKQAPFPQMQNVLATLEPGQVSSVFKGPDGFYIIKLEEKKGGKVKLWIEIKDRVVAGLTLKKQQEAMLSYINQLATKTTIKVNEKLLEN